MAGSEKPDWLFLEFSLGFLNNLVHLLCRVRGRAKTDFCKRATSTFQM